MHSTTFLLWFLQPRICPNLLTDFGASLDIFNVVKCLLPHSVGIESSVQ